MNYNRYMQFIKRVLTDVLGVLLIIIAPLLGWLPGPGGIPLFFVGLGLLSINHDWAKRLLEYLKTHGLKRLERLLRENIHVQRATDVVGIFTIAVGSWYLFTKPSPIKYFGVLYIGVGGLLLLISRERYKKIVRKP